MFLIVLAALLCFSSCANGNYWSNCPGSTNSATSVTVTGCDSSMNVCSVKRGSNVTIQISGVAPEDMTVANVTVTAYVGILPFSFPLSNPNSCTTSGSGVTCPIFKGTPFTYSYGFQVPSSYPPTSALVEISMKDQSSVLAWCVDLNTQLT